MRKNTIKLLFFAVVGLMVLTDCKKKEEDLPTPEPTVTPTPSTNGCYIQSIKTAGVDINNFTWDGIKHKRIAFYDWGSGDLKGALEPLYYTNGAVGKISQLANFGSEIAFYSLSYYNVNQVKQINYYVYDASGKEKFQRAQAYSYDIQGKITGMMAGILAANGELNATEAYEYFYDGKGNVVKEKFYTLGTSGSKVLNDSIMYTYDDKVNPNKGRIVSPFLFNRKMGLDLKDAGFIRPVYYSSANNIIKSVMINEFGDAELTVNCTYTYDDKGNPITMNRKTIDHLGNPLNDDKFTLTYKCE